MGYDSNFGDFRITPFSTIVFDNSFDTRDGGVLYHPVINVSLIENRMSIDAAYIWSGSNTKPPFTLVKSENVNVGSTFQMSNNLYLYDKNYVSDGDYYVSGQYMYMYRRAFNRYPNVEGDQIAVVPMKYGGSAETIYFNLGPSNYYSSNTYYQNKVLRSIYCFLTGNISSGDRLVDGVSIINYSMRFLHRVQLLETTSSGEVRNRAFILSDKKDVTIDELYLCNVGSGTLRDIFTDAQIIESIEYIGEYFAIPDTTIRLTFDIYLKLSSSDPYGNDGYSSSNGGGGSFGKNESSDNILKDLPSGSVEADASATGMYTRYLVNSSYLDIIGDWLWTTDLGLAVAKSVISLLYGDPAESVIGLMSFPFNLQSAQGLITNRQHLFWGHHDSGLDAIAIRSNAVTIDWGTISLSEYWGNFLDYTPHTKIELYLPWGTGFVSIDPGQCLPGTLRVITNVELTKGSCIHNVIGNDGNVIGSFAGQCAKQLPLFSSDFASKVAGLVTAAAAGIGVGAAGAVGAAGGAALGSKMGAGYASIGGSAMSFMTKGERMIDEAASQAASNVSQAGRFAGKIATSSLAVNKSPTHVTRNGGFTDGSAALGIQFPYIILSRPTQSVPKEYGHHYGYPSNIYSSLYSLKGYTEIGEIHLDGVPGSADELSELDRILKEGVIF